LARADGIPRKAPDTDTELPVLVVK